MSNETYDAYAYYRVINGYYEEVKFPVDGKALVNILCNRLTHMNRLATDGNIVSLLRNMSRVELNQAVNLGDVTEWHNDRVKKEMEESSKISLTISPDGDVGIGEVNNGTKK